MGTAPSGEILSHGHGMGSVFSVAHHGLLSEANPFPASCHAVLCPPRRGTGRPLGLGPQACGGTGTQAPSPDEPASMKASRTSLAELECKLPGLPAETQASVRAIMQSANNILGCMATDPRDVDHGARFLKRSSPPPTASWIRTCVSPTTKTYPRMSPAPLPGATTCSPG